MPRTRLSEIECPNCHQRLSVWQNKRGSGFVSCGLCGYHATNIQVDNPPAADNNESVERSFSAKVNSNTLTEGSKNGRQSGLDTASDRELERELSEEI